MFFFVIIFVFAVEVLISRCELARKNRSFVETLSKTDKLTLIQLDLSSLDACEMLIQSGDCVRI